MAPATSSLMMMQALSQHQQLKHYADIATASLLSNVSCDSDAVRNPASLASAATFRAPLLFSLPPKSAPAGHYDLPRLRLRARELPPPTGQTPASASNDVSGK